MMKMLFYTGLSLHAAGIAVNLVFGSLLPLVAWGILRQLTSCREIALGAAFLMAFHPSAIGLSADVTRDTLYLFTGGSAVLFALANFAVWGGTFLISALAIALLTGVLPQTAAAYNERIQRISIQKI